MRLRSHKTRAVRTNKQVTQDDALVDQILKHRTPAALSQKRFGGRFKGWSSTETAETATPPMKRLSGGGGESKDDLIDKILHHSHDSIIDNILHHSKYLRRPATESTTATTTTATTTAPKKVWRDTFESIKKIRRANESPLRDMDLHTQRSLPDGDRRTSHSRHHSSTSTSTNTLRRQAARPAPAPSLLSPEANKCKAFEHKLMHAGKHCLVQGDSDSCQMCAGVTLDVEGPCEIKVLRKACKAGGKKTR